MTSGQRWLSYQSREKKNCPTLSLSPKDFLRHFNISESLHRWTVVRIPSVHWSLVPRIQRSEFDNSCFELVDWNLRWSLHFTWDFGEIAPKGLHICTAGWSSLGTALAPKKNSGWIGHCFPSSNGSAKETGAEARCQHVIWIIWPLGWKLKIPCRWQLGCIARCWTHTWVKIQPTFPCHVWMFGPFNYESNTRIWTAFSWYWQPPVSHSTWILLFSCFRCLLVATNARTKTELPQGV